MAAARAQLEWVEANGKQPEVVDVARIRLARLMVDAGEPDAAMARIEGVDGGAFAGQLAELRGDAYRLKGDSDAARDAYTQAMLAGTGSQVLLQMKLDDLGTAGTSQ